MSIIKKYECFGEIFILSLFSALVFFIGVRIETGITPDSLIKYIPVSENIYQKGIEWYIFNNSYETTVVPPFYEFLTSFLMIFNLNANHSAGLVSLFSLIFLSFPLFYIGKILGGKYLGYATIILCYSMKVLWDNGTSAMSEMLFIFLIYMSILFFIRHFFSNHSIDLIISAFFLILANYTRWIGIFLLLAYITHILVYSYFDRKNFKNLYILLMTTLPPIILLYLRNILIGAEIYSIPKTSLSISDFFINIFMILGNITWDFLALNPYNYFNQFLMDFYFLYLYDNFSINQISMLIPVQYFNYYWFIFIIILFISIILIYVNSFQGYIIKLINDFYLKKWPFLIIFILIYYLGILLYTESTTELSLIDSRYLSPLYPLFIFLFIKILFKSLNWSKDDNQLNKYLIIIILASFFVIQASASLLFLNEYSYGRGFSDPKVTEGSAYHWLINNWSNNDEIYINDGLQVNYWQKSFFPYIFGLPNRNYPIKNFLYDLKKGTYIVIVPVIQTKGPYRWIELEPILKDINKFDILLNDKEEKIFRVK